MTREFPGLDGRRAAKHIFKVSFMLEHTETKNCCFKKNRKVYFLARHVWIRVNFKIYLIVIYFNRN